MVDTSGGILPGADVVLTNEGTGIVERQVTSATGEFLFNYVPAGSYTLAISISGFKTLDGQGDLAGGGARMSAAGSSWKSAHSRKPSR